MPINGTPVFGGFATNERLSERNCMAIVKLLSERAKELEVVSTIASIAVSIAGTVAAIALGLMALRLSVNSNNIADAQLKVAAQELALNRAAARPRLRAVTKTCPDPSKAGEDYDCVELWNNGPPAGNWFFLQIGFLMVREATAAHSETWGIPVYYFFDRHLTGREQGPLATFEAYRSPGQFSDQQNVSAVWRKLQGELRDAGFDSYLRVFVYVSYIDALGISGEDALEVYPGPDMFFGSGGSKHFTDQARNLLGVPNIDPIDFIDVDSVKQRIRSGETYDLDRLLQRSESPENGGNLSSIR